MYSANSSILCSKEKIGRIVGTWHEYLVNISGLRYFKQIEFQGEITKFLKNLSSLNIFTSNIKQFLWKYHILPTYFWTALVLLRSEQRKY